MENKHLIYGKDIGFNTYLFLVINKKLEISNRNKINCDDIIKYNFEKESFKNLIHCSFINNNYIDINLISHNYKYSLEAILYNNHDEIIENLSNNISNLKESMKFYSEHNQDFYEINLKSLKYAEMKNSPVFKIKNQDLFEVDDKYYLAHCISADFGMGKGIVIEFNKRFNMKNTLQMKYPNYINKFHSKNIKGDCLLEGKVLNLITKERYYQKPTLESMDKALKELAEICTNKNIEYLAMPKIGCGLDKLQWDDVFSLIKKNLKNTLLKEIIICIK